MTATEIQAWRDRWRLVNELEEEELRRTPPDVRLRQLEALYASVDVLGWRKALEEGESEVRDLWRRLKEKHGVRTR